MQLNAKQVKFKKIIQLLLFNILWVDASKSKSPTSSTLGYVSIGNESKDMCIPTDESQVKSCRVLILECHGRSKGRP